MNLSRVPEFRPEKKRVIKKVCWCEKFFPIFREKFFGEI